MMSLIWPQNLGVYSCYVTIWVENGCGRKQLNPGRRVTKKSEIPRTLKHRTFTRNRLDYGTKMNVLILGRISSLIL